LLKNNLLKHLIRHIEIYNPEKIIGMDFNMFGVSENIILPTVVNMVITKIPTNVNFADKLLDRVFNYDIITNDKSIISDMPSQSAF
jgi:hypothetical protein